MRSRPSLFSSPTQLSLPTARSEQNDSELSHHAYPQQRKLSHPASQKTPLTLGEDEMTRRYRKEQPALPGTEAARRHVRQIELCPLHCQIAIERERARALEICYRRDESRPFSFVFASRESKKGRASESTPARCRLVKLGPKPANTSSITLPRERLSTPGLRSA